eukprot:COSAG02_NODE_5455_length_4302_cov_4.540328_3_plen_119_part_00
MAAVRRAVEKRSQPCHKGPTVFGVSTSHASNTFPRETRSLAFLAVAVAAADFKLCPFATLARVRFFCFGRNVSKKFPPRTAFSACFDVLGFFFGARKLQHITRTRTNACDAHSRSQKE